jgi:hypothetical protein
LESQAHFVVRNSDSIVESREPNSLRNLCAQNFGGGTPNFIMIVDLKLALDFVFHSALDPFLVLKTVTE